MPKILIAGAGIAGGYLWRLLVKRGMSAGDIEIVDPGSRTRCGIPSCGFATTRQFFTLCREAGLEPEKYILASPDMGYANSMKFTVKGHIFSIDKPAFIRDLLEGAAVNSRPSDMAVERIIDATGTARAYIGKYEHDLLHPCIQRKVEFPDQPVLAEYAHNVGYAWVIPLEGSNAHVGIGSNTYDAEAMKKVVDGLAQGTKTICACQGLIRGTGPILPLVRGNVWAVGEAGGIVDPLSGAGIIPAMVSAKLLVEHWDDLKGYEAAIMKKYGWFRKTAKLVEEWQDRGSLNTRKLLGLWKEYADLAGLDYSVLSLARIDLVRSMLGIALRVPKVRRRWGINQQG
jgi:flavin-dependent dehydrogenase